jgi:LAO/AO transport system kinase
MKPLPADLAALAAGGKAALARCLTALEAAPDDPALTALLDAAWQHPRGFALGLTGPPGVGKSTLGGGFLTALRARGETVAVIAVDPSSRASGGALLGDRLRLATDPEDSGAFVRSMAARGRLGGLASATFPAVVLARALYDWVLVETVGVGQSETDIADIADLVVLCVQPGSGDAVQFMKAGIMEVPDLVLVTKADLGAPARRAVADLHRALALAPPGPGRPVAAVSAAEGTGVEAALDRIAAACRGRAGLASRRAGQARAWAAGRLVESFGAEGAAFLLPRLDAGTAPFAPLAGLANRARTALHESLKDL